MDPIKRTQQQAIMIADAMHMSKELRTNHMTRDRQNEWVILDNLQVRLEGKR